MRVRIAVGLLAGLFLGALIGLNAEAQEYSYFNAEPNFNDGNAGPYHSYDQKISYDTETSTFKLQISFDPVDGNVAPDGIVDGLVFSVTGGPGTPPSDYDSCAPLCCPIWGGAEAAVFYLDATNPAAPKVSAYVYNGRSPHPKSGWLPSGCPSDDSYSVGPAGITGSKADLIHSSSDTGWIIENTVTDGANGRRTFTLEFDATSINEYVPLYASNPNNWQGTGVNDTINYKMWPFIIADYSQNIGNYISYAADGSLTNFRPSGCGRKLVCDEDTDIGPECNAIGAGQADYSNVKCGGISTTVKLDGSGSYDPDDGPEALTYDWSSNCPGAFIDAPKSVSPKITFSSLTKDGKPTVCNVSLRVRDGFAGERCNATISVAACPKDCKGVPNGTAKFDRCGECDGDGSSCIKCEEENVAASLIELDSGANKITGVAKKLRAKIRKIRGGKSSVAEQKLVEAAKTLTNKLWQDINQRIPVKFNVCEVTEFCINTSHADVLEDYKAGSNQLLEIVRELGAAYTKVLIKVKGLSKAEATKLVNRIVNQASQQNEANQAEASSIPSVSSACF